MDDPDPKPHPPTKSTPKRTIKLWPTRCSPSAKVIMISALLLAFITQTLLVYADTTPTTQLNEQAKAGRKLWLKNNCQACHQIHGFGGFLGPDLTNATARFKKDKLQDQLQNGSAQMPKFDLDQNQTDNLWAYLQSLNQTGTGQARNPNSQSFQAINALAANSADPAPLKGFKLFQSNTCTSCHTLFATSAVNAPDLTLTASRLTPAGITTILTHGRPPSMPPTGFTQTEQASIQSFLVFINNHRDEIINSTKNESLFSYLSSLPWWEFE